MLSIREKDKREKERETNIHDLNTAQTSDSTLPVTTGWKISALQSTHSTCVNSHCGLYSQSKACKQKLRDQTLACRQYPSVATTQTTVHSRRTAPYSRRWQQTHDKAAVALFTNICFPGNAAYLLLRVRGCVLDVLTPRAAVVVFRRKTVGDVGGHVTKPSTTIGHENWSVLWSMCTDRVSRVKNAVRRWEHNATLLATGKYKTSWRADRINNSNYGISETQWSLSITMLILINRN